jgi:hypothetical protein
MGRRGRSSRSSYRYSGEATTLHTRCNVLGEHCSKNLWLQMQSEAYNTVCTRVSDALGRGPYVANPGTYERTSNSSRRRMTNTSTCTAQSALLGERKQASRGPHN